MNAQLLLAHFNRISSAPDAIQRLRQFILELAVRGKLCDQDPDDEPAPRLMNKIETARALLGLAEGITNQGVAALVNADMPFEIPPNWIWVQLNDICSKTGSGSTPRGGKSVYQGKGVPFLRSQNVYDDGLRLDNVAYITQEIHEKMSGTRVRAGDLLLNITGGSIGRCCHVPNGIGQANVSQHIAIIRVALDGIQSYLHKVILSPYFQSFVLGEQTGAGRGGLPKNRMDRIPVALPPLAEQHRIVAKVNELMALCDRLEAAQAEREARRDRLAAASLHRLNQPAAPCDSHAFRGYARFHLQHLSRVTTRAEHLKQLRQTILNLAVRGQLVPQDPNDEPASELLRLIRAEKARLMRDGIIRKERPLPSIEESAIPFNLPTGWCWTRLGQLSELVTSGSRDWAKFYSSDGAIFVRMGNLSRDSYQLRLGNIQRVKAPPDGEGTRTRLEEGDILISITGEVGLLGLIPPHFGESYINQHTCLVRPMAQLRSRYLPELFRSQFAQNQFDEPQRGLKNSFRLTDVTHILVPLPPLAEQHRIVAKVDELMTLCDQLETQLTVTQSESRRLLESLLYEALNGSLARDDVATITTT